MAWSDYSTGVGRYPRCAGYPGSCYDLAAIFESFDDQALVKHLEEHRYNGRHGYSVRAMFRAYFASFILNLPHTNALIRKLREDASLREICGFGSLLPHRRTFNRFIKKLSEHLELVEQVSHGFVIRLQEWFPDLGEETAIDSTVVRSHSNPNRRNISDPEASWTAKNSARAKENGKEWYWGYKLHMMVDAKYGIPLAQLVTTAKRNDSPLLPAVVEKARETFPWLQLKAVMADRGYDASSNHHYLHGEGVLPIILQRRTSHRQDGLLDGIYTTEGVPTCLGKVPMEYIRSDPIKGHLYRCRTGGCHLVDSRVGMTRHCKDETWEDPTTNIKLFGVIRRDSPEWKALYAKRQTIERTFKSMKESRRLERHCVRGLQQITLHSLMSSMSYEATALLRAETGQSNRLRWMVQKVA